MDINAHQKYERNISRFLTPFYLPLSKRDINKPVFSEGWDAIERRSVYLTQYFREIYGKQTNSICKLYRLKADARKEASLPAETETAYLISEMTDETERTHSFFLKDITVAHFATGMGFLILDIAHGDEQTLEEVTDKSFALANIFIYEEDDSQKPSKLHFYYFDGEKKIFFSMKNAVNTVLGIGKGKEAIELFPTNPRKKMNVYHSVFMERREDKDRKMVDVLSRGLSSNAVKQKETYDFLESDFEYSTTENTGWRICSNGVVSLTYDEAENHNFLRNVYLRNVSVDYFLVYLFALHEREILLRYNYEVIKNWNNSKKLIAMRKELIKFNLWFSYNTVSVEMSYQNFYECLYRALKLDKLENDIQEVVTMVNEYVTANKERKMNGILSAITILAVISAFTDGLGLMDRLYQDMPLKAGHIAVLCCIFLVISTCIFYFIHKDES